MSDLAERLWARLDRSGGEGACWPAITGGVIGRGYRTMYVRDVEASLLGLDRHAKVGHHRIAFAVTRGRPAVGVVRHACDNPPCANPAHVVEGTQSQNMRDAVRRGRVRPQGRTGLGIEVARQIRERLSAGETRLEIATEYGVTVGAVAHIAHGLTYKD